MNIEEYRIKALEMAIEFAKNNGFYYTSSTTVSNVSRNKTEEEIIKIAQKFYAFITTGT